MKPDWHIAYSSVNGQTDPSYVPEDIFYREIIPRLNRQELIPAYKDKNSYRFF